MTAVNVLLGPNECHIITDGAGTIPKTIEGRRHQVLWIKVPKVFSIPHLGLAVVFRGRTALMHSLFYRASRARTVEDLRRTFPIELRRRFGLLAKLLPSVFDFELIFAGVSDGKPFIFVVATTTRLGWRPFIANEITDSMLSPSLRDESVAQGWELAARGQGSCRRLDDVACRILQHQRYSGIVGAFGQITTVNQFGIHTRIIKRWPDEYGKSLGHLG